MLSTFHSQYWFSGRKSGRGGAKESADQCNMFREGKPNPDPRINSNKKEQVFTEDLLQRVPWAEVLAIGPDDPLHNWHQVFCRSCRVNVSMRARGIYEVKRHYQSPNRLPQDQCYLEEICPHAVSGNDTRVLRGDRIVVEREIYMDWQCLEMDHKRRFYYDMVEGLPLMFTSVEDRVGIQTQLLITFLKAGGQLWVSEDFWNQVGNLKGNAASKGDSI